MADTRLAADADEATPKSRRRAGEERRRRAHRFVSRLFLATVAACGVARHEPVDFRDIPSAVELWRWRGSIDTALASHDLVFVADKGRVSAIDPRDGTLRRTTIVGKETDECCRNGVHLLVGDRLFVPLVDSVLVLDAKDGSVLDRVHIGEGRVSQLAGPPVVAFVSGEARSTLVKLDEHSGAEVARRELPPGADLDRIGDWFVLNAQVHQEQAASTDEKTESHTILMGFDGDLQERWRQSVSSGASLGPTPEGDHLLVLEPQVKGAGRHPYLVRPLDPRTGELGPPLVEPRDHEHGGSFFCEDGSHDSAIEFFWAAGSAENPRTPSWRLVRKGRDGWRSESLPGSPEVLADHEYCRTWGTRLLVRLRAGGSRTVLAVLRARSGELENLLLLEPNVMQVLVVSNRVVLQRRDALIGIDALNAGPTEAQSRSLEESVAAILANEDDADVGDIREDLEALGPEALPIAVAALPHLEGQPLLAVADWAADRVYTAAAPALATALERTAAATTAPTRGGAARGDSHEGELRPGSDDRQASQVNWLARALAAVAGPAQVAVLARHLNPPGGDACPEEVFSALGRIGTTEAVAAIDRLVANASRSTDPWFRPPRPGSAAHAIASGFPVLESVPVNAATPPSHRLGDLVGSWSSTELQIANQRELIFTEDEVGNGLDLWISGSAEAGHAEPKTVFFLGYLGACHEIKARVVKGNLRVDCEKPPDIFYFPPHGGLDVEEDEEDVAATATTHPLQLRLGFWRRDSDGDGLTDLLERRLGLDPARADTDGDGIGDAVDRAPNAQVRRAADRTEDELLLSALAGIWACYDTENFARIRWITGAPALEWRGSRGVVINASNAVLAGPELGRSLMRVELDRERPATPDDEGSFELAPGERRVTVQLGDVHGPPEVASGQSAILRRHGDRWLVVRFEYGP